MAPVLCDSKKKYWLVKELEIPKANTTKIFLRKKHSYERQCIFFFPFYAPHHASAISFLILSQRAGIAKQLITNVGY
jgi:hypothetical protein